MRFLIACALLCSVVRAEMVHVKSDQPNPAVRDDKGDPYVTSTHGHGVFISAHRILTVNHVMESDNAFFESGGKWIACKVVRRDAKNDLCLLETEATAKTVAPLAKNTALATVQLHAQHVKVTAGPIIIYSNEFSIGTKDSPSGCPLFNRDGELCGLVTHGFKEIDKHGKEGPIIGAHAVSIETILEFLK